MPVTTLSAAVHLTPVVIKTFFKHWKRKAERVTDPEDHKEIPQDELFFDQAFHIVKSFIALGTKNTIESLQAFTNTHVPAPPWAAVSPVLIPLKSCNDAADRLIEWFGPDELKKVVGGERWWQVRGLDGIDAEWVAEEEDLLPDDELKANDGRKLTVAEANILRMEKLESVLFYVHGGAYFWGSINTHRYQILHYAHKIKGRAFAVNYRKAPQYPWPCPVQDVLAAYLYLIQPPPDAIHKPVSPEKIVFAGDSAGGALCLTTLTVLRDLGLPMPSGAVLISPWVDLTHSFPSVMENYKTDIVPRHGFIAKPSTLWPIPTAPEDGGRVVPTVTNDPPEPGKADTLKPSPKRLERDQESETDAPGETVKTQQAMLDERSTPSSQEDDRSREKEVPSVPSPQMSGLGQESNDEVSAQKAQDAYDIDHWEPKPPKVLMEDPSAVPLELRSQIQMYASTELLTHPLVSPILQGSLGNLPPLYIIAGDGEVLRDEITYLAHKAANPAEYPTRPGVLRDGHRQKENVEKFTTPTKVHFQLFDGMCHVLTVFMFTKSAKYAYRSIAEFTRHITRYDEEHIKRNPFPELHRPPDEIPPDGLPGERVKSKKAKQQKSMPNSKEQAKEDSSGNGTFGAMDDARRSLSPDSDVEMYLQNEQITTKEVGGVETDPGELSSSSNDTKVGREKEKEEEVTSAAHFIRERVDIRGKVRPMEPAEELAALRMKPSQIGIIKEAPTRRWLDGQIIWDERYKSDAKRVIKQKAKCEAKAEKILKNALEQGLVHDRQATSIEGDDGSSKVSMRLRKSSSVGEIQADRRWGPLDLLDERPPATAIAGRRDTPEAVALLKKSIYHTAPVTHRTVPKLKPMEAVAAALDPNDDPIRPPRQSVSEQQVEAHIIPMHGLRMWDGLLRYFGRKTSAKAAVRINSAAEKVGLKNGETDGMEDEKERAKSPKRSQQADRPTSNGSKESQKEQKDASMQPTDGSATNPDDNRAG